MKRALAVVLLLVSVISPPAIAASSVVVFTADVWADNWFAMYVNGKLVGQDSVPFTTTKSFNKETLTFSASYPLTIGFVAKDYVENSSGLEYIGTSNQQIGDGGFIAQIYERDSQKLVAVTDKSWKMLSISRAPLNPDCVSAINPLTTCHWSEVKPPTNWFASSFKDGMWGTATEYSREQVGVKGGFLEVSWNPLAQLIWGKDLKIDNTILLRKVINAPMKQTLQTMKLSIDGSINGTLPKDVTCDGVGSIPNISWSGIPRGTKSIAVTMETIPGPPRPGEVNSGNHFSLVAYNIPPNSTNLVGATFGRNFQKRNGYAPPCSQGPGLKTYTVTLYALNSLIDFELDIDGQGLQDQAAKFLISKVSSDFGYSRS